MRSVIKFHKDLHQQLDQLYPIFLAGYPQSGPIEQTPTFLCSVKAYCLLSHAAFEHFFENVGLALLNKAEEEFLSDRTISLTTASLILHFAEKPSIDENEENSEVLNFDLIRNQIKTIKERYSKMIHENHGISKKYLRKMFQPVGINIIPDTLIHDSLQLLARQRGQFAHKFSAFKVYPPEEIVGWTQNIMRLCEDIVMQIIQRHPENIY